MEKRKLTKTERKDEHNREICCRVKQNDSHALTLLLLENEGLILQIARELEAIHEIDINHYGGIELQDILQEGRIAMIEAAKSYDPSSGVKFSTFAYKVMRNAMNDLCRKGDSSFERRLAYDGDVQVFLDDDPTDDDGIPEQEKIPDGDIPDPVGNLVVRRLRSERIWEFFCGLSEREQKILSFRYGLIVFEEEKSIPETAKYFHLSKNNLKSIEKKALGKLRREILDDKFC
nr:sigma-70 family RNA polymerase sigma factor [uncultured Butyrivibrio sp.]